MCPEIQDVYFVLFCFVLLFVCLFDMLFINIDVMGAKSVRLVFGFNSQLEFSVGYLSLFPKLISH